MTETHNHGFRVLGVAVEGSFGLCSAIAHLYFKSCGKYGFLKQPDYVEKNRTKLPGLRVKCEDTDLVFLAALHPGDLRHWRETLKGCTETRREQLGLLQKLAALPRWSTNIFTPRMHGLSCSCFVPVPLLCPPSPLSLWLQPWEGPSC